MVSGPPAPASRDLGVHEVTIPGNDLFLDFWCWMPSEVAGVSLQIHVLFQEGNF